MESHLFSQPLQQHRGAPSSRRVSDWTAAPSSPARRESSPPALRFVDPADGRRWTVVEQPGDRIPGARGPSCLCFQAQDIFRRVWRFPENWRELSAAELAALSRSW
jgi:hypothetical protein